MCLRLCLFSIDIDFARIIVKLWHQYRVHINKLQKKITIFEISQRVNLCWFWRRTSFERNGKLCVSKNRDFVKRSLQPLRYKTNWNPLYGKTTTKTTTITDLHRYEQTYRAICCYSIVNFQSCEWAREKKNIINALMIKLFSIVIARDSFELAAQLIWWMDFFHFSTNRIAIWKYTNKISIEPLKPLNQVPTAKHGKIDINISISNEMPC